MSRKYKNLDIDDDMNLIILEKVVSYEYLNCEWKVRVQTYKSKFCILAYLRYLCIGFQQNWKPMREYCSLITSHGSIYTTD